MKPKMILVDGGSFYSDKIKITVDSFYIAKYVITNKVYSSLLADYKKDSNLPKTIIKFKQVVEFCNVLSKKEKLLPVYTYDVDDVLHWNLNSDGYRLPTEAEWEYAARGGNESQGFIYSGSNDASAVAWLGGNGEGRTHQPGLKLSNELGIYDMSGNIFEFCWDIYEGRTSANVVNELVNPRGPTSGDKHVCKGGSYNVSMHELQITDRWYVTDDQFSGQVGFRLARSVI